MHEEKKPMMKYVFFSEDRELFNIKTNVLELLPENTGLAKV